MPSTGAVEKPYAARPLRSWMTSVLLIPAEYEGLALGVADATGPADGVEPPRPLLPPRVRSTASATSATATTIATAIRTTVRLDPPSLMNPPSVRGADGEAQGASTRGSVHSCTVGRSRANAQALRRGLGRGPAIDPDAMCTSPDE